MLAQILCHSSAFRSYLTSMLKDSASEFLRDLAGFYAVLAEIRKLSRCDADDPLEVKGKSALIREPDAERDLRQAELIACPQEVLCSFNAAHVKTIVGSS